MKIFLSYRRSDTSGYANGLHDRLVQHFGTGSIVRDLDTIPAGADFVRFIEESIDSSDVVVALIGRDWLRAKDSKGKRRLDDPDDYVRLELSRALESEIPVIPVLVEEATMPSRDKLPPELARLATRNALEISDSRWRHDVDRLITALETYVGQPLEPVPEAAEPPPRPPAQGQAPTATPWSSASNPIPDATSPASWPFRRAAGGAPQPRAASAETFRDASPHRLVRRVGIPIGGLLVLVTVALLLLPSPGDNEPRRGNVNPDDVRVGDCMQLPAPGSDSLTYRDCAEPHDFEVFAIVQHPAPLGAPYPGDEPLVQEGRELCVPHFEPYVGVPLAESQQLLLWRFVPNETNWNVGNRETWCGVQAKAGQLRGSVKGSRR